MTGTYVIDTARERLDLERVHHWLSTDAYWASGYELGAVRRAAEASLNFGVYDDAGGQVGYARVVTDFVTFGWLCDVYVAPEHRGRGLGTRLARAVVAELAPYRLRRLMLATRDAHEVYAQAGFAAVADPAELMRLHPAG